MGMEISIYSDMGRELWKWDHTVDEIHPADKDRDAHEQLHGMRPGRGGIPDYPRYPMMMYRARKNAQGKVLCIDVPPDPEFYQDPRAYEIASLQIDSKNRTCHTVAQNEHEQKQKRAEGWSDTQQEAIAKFEGLERDIANAAAEERYRLQGMSKKAQAEYNAADALTDAHLTDVQPRKKRGRPAKGVRGVTSAAVAAKE